MRLVIALIAGSLAGGSALTLHQAQRNARAGIEQRYTARAGLAANFVSTYISQLTTREKTVAVSSLSGPDPSGPFAAATTAFGFQAGVLLDSTGRALSVEPFSAAAIGRQLGTQYPHLTEALEGRVAASNVISSAVLGLPAVAFAVPFATPQGRRVFSGAYLVSDTPLAAFLSDTTAVRGAQLYLTDSTGKVIAKNGQAAPASAGIQSLAQVAPDLDRATRRGSSNGDYTMGSIAYDFARAPVPGTPWTLLMAVPSRALFVSVSGSSHWLPWVILGCLSLLLALAGWLAIRLVAGRRGLAELNSRLAALAQTDELTGLSSRGHMTEQLEAWLAQARRQHFPLAVLMIDIDHFKSLNDSHGHRAGDIALREVARRLKGSLRQTDLVARWGGEEFLAVLPYSGLADSRSWRSGLAPPCPARRSRSPSAEQRP